MLPAQAGVIPHKFALARPDQYAPRAGGGDPENIEYRGDALKCSPRRRG